VSGHDFSRAVGQIQLVIPSKRDQANAQERAARDLGLAPCTASGPKANKERYFCLRARRPGHITAEWAWNTYSVTKFKVRNLLKFVSADNSCWRAQRGAADIEWDRALAE